MKNNMNACKYKEYLKNCIEVYIHRIDITINILYNYEWICMYKFVMGFLIYKLQYNVTSFTGIVIKEKESFVLIIGDEKYKTLST